MSVLNIVMGFLTSSERIEEVFEKYFQRTIHMSVNNELLKSGKFLLIKNNILSNNFFFEITIERIKKLDIVRIPFPFHMEEHDADRLLYLDYRISTFTKNKPELEGYVRNWLKSAQPTPSKYFDNILEIQFE